MYRALYFAKYSKLEGGVYFIGGETVRFPLKWISRLKFNWIVTYLCYYVDQAIKK